MLAPLINEDSDGASVDVIEAASRKRIAGGGEIDDLRSEVEFAVKPWLHRVLIARRDIE